MYSKWRGSSPFTMHYIRGGERKMESVATYSTTVAGYGTITVVAKDASELDINPEEVNKACEAVMTATEDSFNNIGDEIIKVKCGKDALSAEDSSMEPVLEETGNALKSVPEQLTSIIEEIQQQALEAHDVKQREYNSEALTNYNAKVNAAMTEVQEKNE